MRRFAATAAIVAALGIAALSHAVAQDPPQRAADFGERVDVEVVNVDVVVLDERGERVVDLKRGDFELTVDDRPMPIDYFLAPSAQPARPAPSTAAAAAGPADPTDVSTANLFVFVDQSALQWRTSKKILEEIAEFVLPRTGGAERIMIAAFSENLRILSPPTNDRARIEQALNELEVLRGRGSLVAAERNRLEREVREQGKPRPQARILDPETGEISQEQYVREAGQEQLEAEMLLAEVESFGEQEIDRQQRAVAALRSWIGALAAIEGRKSVLFASAGFTSQPEQFLSQFLTKKRSHLARTGGAQSDLPLAGISLVDDFEKTVRAAQNARVAFYAVSAREAVVAQSSAEFGGSGVAITTPPPRDPAVAEAASSLRRIADATGGTSLFLDDDLSARLSTVSDDAAAAYSLGFTTDEAAGDRDHRIRVRVRRDGYTVRHRESFRRTTLGERAEAALVAAATLETTANPLALRLELGTPEPLDRRGREALVPILVRIPLALVTLIPDGTHRAARLTARIGVQNEERQVRLGESAPIEIRIPESDLERALGSFWAYRAEVMVGRGRQTVAVVIADEAAGTVSTLLGTIDRPVD